MRTLYLNWKTRVPIFFALLSCLIGFYVSAVEPLNLNSVREVREMSPEQAAQGHPVRLRGVVTFYDPENDVGLLLQDSTAAIFVKLGQGTVQLSDATNVHAGDEIEVEGITGPGDYLPVILARELRILGPGALPHPDNFSYEQLAAGDKDCQWIEIQGVVRSLIQTTKDRASLNVMLNGQRLVVEVEHLDVAKATNLVCSTVSIQGVCRTRFNQRRQLCAPYMSTTSLSNIVIEVPAPKEIREMPLADLAQFNSSSSYGQRIRVRGIVTKQNGNSLFIQSDGTGLYVQSVQTNPVSPGDAIEVTGFPVLGQYAPEMEDAVFRVIGHQHQPAPVNVEVNQLLSEDYDNMLVCLRGRLINRVKLGKEQLLILEATNLILNARLDSVKADGHLSALQDGSELELTGVCQAQETENWNPAVESHPEAFELLLRSSNDIAVIHNPPVWTLKRLLCVLGILTLVLLAGLMWVFALNRKVHQQTVVIRQKFQREAVLEERSRIAREFHDSLEQELTAIKIQLETATDQFDIAPNVARQTLKLAHDMARRSLIEARRSVWDLRSHLLENSNLVTALSELIKLMANNTHTAISVETYGTPRKLPLQTENNLLRVAQEALANALKHSRANRIVVCLHYTSDKASIRVMDDGAGFDLNKRSGIFGGHFGLQDMTERAQKMGGHLDIVSAPGQGTQIVIEVAEKVNSAVADAPEPALFE